MYILINKKSEGPTAYRLSKEDIVLGSSPDVHIVIQDVTVSRKHLRLTSINNRWFVRDLGSRNGSFIQTMQLIPGKKYEINGDEPIALGDSIKLQLVEAYENATELSNADSEASSILTPPPSVSDEDKTKMIDLTEFKKLTQKENKKSESLVGQKKNPKKRGILDAMIYLLFGMTIVVSFYMKNEAESELDRYESVVMPVKEPKPVIEKNNQNESVTLNKDKIYELLNGPKCAEEKTKLWCLNNPTFQTGKNGIIFVPPENYLFYIEESELIEKLNKLLPMDTSFSYFDLQKLVLLNFMKTNIDRMNFGAKANLYFNLYRQNENGYPGLTVFLIAGEKISLLREELQGFDPAAGILTEKIQSFFSTL